MCSKEFLTCEFLFTGKTWLKIWMTSLKLQEEWWTFGNVSKTQSSMMFSHSKLKNCSKIFSPVRAFWKLFSWILKCINRSNLLQNKACLLKLPRLLITPWNLWWKPIRFFESSLMSDKPNSLLKNLFTFLRIFSLISGLIMILRFLWTNTRQH